MTRTVIDSGRVVSSSDRETFFNCDVIFEYRYEAFVEKEVQPDATDLNVLINTDLTMIVHSHINGTFHSKIDFGCVGSTELKALADRIMKLAYQVEALEDRLTKIQGPIETKKENH